MIYALLSQNFVVEIYALFLQKWVSEWEGNQKSSKKRKKQRVREWSVCWCITRGRRPHQSEWPGTLLGGQGGKNDKGFWGMRWDCGGRIVRLGNLIQGIEGNRGLAREVKRIRCFKEWGESGGAYIITAKKSAFRSKKKLQKSFPQDHRSQIDKRKAGWRKVPEKKQFTIYSTELVVK